MFLQLSEEAREGEVRVFPKVTWSFEIPASNFSSVTRPPSRSLFLHSVDRHDVMGHRPPIIDSYRRQLRGVSL